LARELVERVAPMLGEGEEWRFVRAFHSRTRANLLAERGEYAEAFELLDDAVAIFRELGESADTAGTLLSIGMLHVKIGRGERGMASIVEAVSLARDIGDEVIQMHAYSALARICYPIGDLDGAMRYAVEWIELARRLGYRAVEVTALVHLGSIYCELGEQDRAIDYHNLSVSLAREMGLREHVFAGMYNIGAIYQRQRRYAEALELLNDALRESLAIGARDGEMRSNLAIAECHMALGAYELALPHLRASWEMARERRDHIWQMRTCRGFHEMYDAVGDIRRALVFHKLRARYEAMIQRNVVQRSLAAIEVDEARRKAAREREEHERAAAEMKREMERRTEALRRMELRLARKSEMIEKIEEEIRPLASGSGGGSVDLVRSLLARVREANDDTDWWSVFEGRFREAHPRFVRMLLERCPALTPAEVRICALMKISLSTKEMGELLRSSARTIENHRRHIRRKLTLGRETSLFTVLASIG
jgi:tetratricopeptide (TPR) repeat protein/DNA-binding CsgD family transcriptional regulator